MYGNGPRRPGSLPQRVKVTNVSWPDLMAALAKHRLDGLMSNVVKIDMLDNENEFVITADLPGVSKDDVDVHVQGNRLDIAYKRETVSEEDSSRAVLKERPSGEYRRTVTLPVDVDSSGVVGSFENGVLTLTLPKAVSTKRQKIAL
jgi:HSP20 family protein